MLRVRFYVRFDACDGDPRPINWPIKHPYWISGEGSDYAILIAYADDEDYIYGNWPEAEGIDILSEEDEYTFTDRFPKPEWMDV